MPIIVDSDLCTSCGECVELCPMDIIRLNDEGLPYQKYDECWYCKVCEEDCPEEALVIDLPFLVK
ncbi:MAG: 4Fe-4S binding protein [Candidatus Heimdallarchaeota archaeon]|nr:4Fe-4S binding protein [Candidatus Heimdallarchaeota archaeon]MCK4877272.1 4Fe-4S binding protein [Candidatus Heimdallarchaeota archaeon]